MDASLTFLFIVCGVIAVVALVVALVLRSRAAPRNPVDRSGATPRDREPR